MFKSISFENQEYFEILESPKLIALTGLLVLSLLSTRSPVSSFGVTIQNGKENSGMLSRVNVNDKFQTNLVGECILYHS